MPLLDALADDTIAAILAVMGEPVSIGPWNGQAVVNGGPHFVADVSGGTYQKDTLTVTIRKADLTVGFIPLPQMDVTARGKNLRIPDDGITEHRASYYIIAVGRSVPR